MLDDPRGMWIQDHGELDAGGRKYLVELRAAEWLELHRPCRDAAHTDLAARAAPPRRRVPRPLDLLAVWCDACGDLIDSMGRSHYASNAEAAEAWAHHAGKFHGSSEPAPFGAVGAIVRLREAVL